MNLPQPSREESRPSGAPKAALIIMGLIVATMTLVALYSNVQRWHRDKVETVVVTPASSPSQSPTTP